MIGEAGDRGAVARDRDDAFDDADLHAPTIERASLTIAGIPKSAGEKAPRR
jgi:hypothetical protein